ncbi:hypothetical protein Tco_0557148 [Tanacetum coccineum]
MPRARPSLASLLRVPKLRCDNRQCHNQLLVFDALDRRQIGEAFSMSSREIIVQIPEDDLDNLSLTREEDDGISVALDPQFLSRIAGFDPQLLVEHFSHVEDNTGVLESDVLDDSTCF